MECCSKYIKPKYTRVILSKNQAMNSSERALGNCFSALYEFWQNQEKSLVYVLEIQSTLLVRVKDAQMKDPLVKKILGESKLGSVKKEF